MKSTLAVAILFVSTICSAQTGSPFGGTTQAPGSSASPFGGANGNATSEVRQLIFDVSRVNGLREIETPARFAKIWNAFRSQYALDESGDFKPELAATTPDNPKTQAAFLRYVATNSPIIRLEEEIVCKACTNGKTPRTEGLNVVYIDCPKCTGTGRLTVVESCKLVFSGPVPAKAATVEAAKSDASGAKSPSAELKMLMDQFMAVGKRFKIDRDEFTKEMHYSPMLYVTNPSSSPALRVSVFDDGSVFMHTFYMGRNWLFHDRFKLMVGDEVFDSPVAKPDMITRKVLRGAVSEMAFYPSDQIGPAEAVARSPQAKVLLRLEGSSGVVTEELSKDQKSALKDAFELSAILKKIYKIRKNAGITGKLGDVK